MQVIFLPSQSFQDANLIMQTQSVANPQSKTPAKISCHMVIIQGSLVGHRTGKSLSYKPLHYNVVRLATSI